MGEVGMAWRVVYRLEGTKKKYPRARRQKNDEGGAEGRMRRRKV